MKISPVAAKLWVGGRTDGRTDGQTDMTKLTVAFRVFWAPKKFKQYTPGNFKAIYISSEI